MLAMLEKSGRYENMNEEWTNLKTNKNSLRWNAW